MAGTLVIDNTAYVGAGLAPALTVSTTAQISGKPLVKEKVPRGQQGRGKPRPYTPLRHKTTEAQRQGETR